MMQEARLLLHGPVLVGPKIRPALEDDSEVRIKLVPGVVKC